MKREELEQLAEGLTRDEKRALLVNNSSIPDSIWHGKYSDFKRWVGPAQWTWSDKGLAVQSILRSKDPTP